MAIHLAAPSCHPRSAGSDALLFHRLQVIDVDHARSRCMNGMEEMKESVDFLKRMRDRYFA